MFEAAFQQRVTLYVASLTFSHVYYTARKTVGPDQARNWLRQLTALVRIVAIDAATVETALASAIPDVEDALQYAAASAQPLVTAIVTRNTRGLPFTPHLPILAPDEADRLVVA